MGFWVGILKRRNWWSTADPRMSVGAPFRINKYMSRTSYEGIMITRVFPLVRSSLVKLLVTILYFAD